MPKLVPLAHRYDAVNRNWMEAGIEPVLCEMLADPLVHLVMRRDGISREEVLARNAKQMPDDEKIKLADYTIVNDDTELVIPQVLALHQQFLQMAAAL